MHLTDRDKGVLLLCARESIMTIFSGNPAPQIDFAYYPDLLERCGAFVTLTKNRELRGCIGYMTSEDPLYETVRECAILAASQDPRFTPVTVDEVKNILIEISVLSPMAELKSYDDIVIGKHGLMIDEPTARGVLLPQVPVEHKMDLSAYLSALCAKAGLPGKEWTQRQLRIKSFTATVFHESEHRALTGEKH